MRREIRFIKKITVPVVGLFMLCACGMSQRAGSMSEEWDGLYYNSRKDAYNDIRQKRAKTRGLEDSQVAMNYLNSPANAPAANHVKNARDVYYNAYENSNIHYNYYDSYPYDAYGPYYAGPSYNPWNSAWYNPWGGWGFGIGFGYGWGGWPYYGGWGGFYPGWGHPGWGGPGYYPGWGSPGWGYPGCWDCYPGYYPGGGNVVQTQRTPNRRSYDAVPETNISPRWNDQQQRFNQSTQGGGTRNPSPSAGSSSGRNPYYERPSSQSDQTMENRTQQYTRPQNNNSQQWSRPSSSPSGGAGSSGGGYNRR